MKNSTGMCSVVLSTAWIYGHYSGVDNQEKIRNCIKEYVANYGIMYVTIFGDADQVPVRYAYVPDDYDTYTATDLYYADLDGSWDDNHDGLYADQRYDNVDGIPDVYVGRIPPSLVEYARAAVDKIKGYQKHFDPSENWTQRAILAAGTCSGDGFSNTDKNGTTVLQEYIANIIRDKSVVKLYESVGNLSAAGMFSEINKGALFLGFAGHGDPGSGFFSVGWLLGWVIPAVWWEGFGTSDVQSLTNGFRLPVVTTMSCSTARFDDTDCLGEWFVLEPNGGSIGYFGATRVAYGYFDEWAPYGYMGEMERRLYENFYEGHTRLGQMWGESVSEYITNNIWNYKYAYNIDVKTAMEFVLLGDPTLNIGQEWDPSTVYLETAYTKPQSRGSWPMISDPSSWSGTVMKAPSSSPNGGCLFGPYITNEWEDKSMLSKPYQVTFRLKTTSNLSGSDIVRVDVAYNAGTVLQSRIIKSSDFASADSWQDFNFTFVAPSSINYGLEFRVLNLNHGVTDIYVDKIEVERLLNDSTAYIESAYNKQQYGSSWTKVSDSSSYSGSVMKAQASSSNGGCLFGPYIMADWSGQAMLGEPFATTFRLKTSSVTSSNDLVNVDICYNAGTVLQSMTIKANDFAAPNTWQDFKISFITPKTMTYGLEFRVRNLNDGLVDIYVDYISVERQSNASSVYVEAAYGKQVTGSSWLKVIDSSSFSGTVMKASGSSSNGAWLYGPYILQDS
jgi:hypothetical protein